MHTSYLSPQSNFQLAILAIANISVSGLSDALFNNTQNKSQVAEVELAKHLNWASSGSCQVAATTTPYADKHRADESALRLCRYETVPLQSKL